MSSQVEQIKERLSVVDVLSSYLTLERAGANYKARCPFHNEKTPSFFISPVRESYYCFGCGAKGDIFTFVQEFEGLDFVGALKILAERAGVPLTYEKPENKDKRERLYECMEMATRFYETELVKSEPAQKYLAERGISKETIKLFRIGYALSEWRELFNYLKGKKFSDAEIEAAGLSKKPDGGVSSPYDRFRGRIMFPIADSSGRIIAFSGRIFPDDQKQ